MSNLGWYQKLTTIAKTVGGPKRLVGFLLAGGAVLGVGGTLLTQKGVKVVKNKINKQNTYYSENGNTFVFLTDAIKDNGLVFKIGDKYKILDRDGEAILIEKIGDDNNPYFVSAEFLKKVSDFNPHE